jgi:thiopeptide-type bacteriocin biosynthesis protein
VSKQTSISESADARRPAASHDWAGLHVFYRGDGDLLLTGWLRPTVERLRAGGAVASYFFIRYWLEGDHVRVRLRPAPGVRRDDFAALVEEGLARFLERHPSTDRPPVLPESAHRRFFLAEYDQSTWDRLYGVDGTMPLRANNTWRWVPYEPEYGRYGGPLGVELSEWHFEVSSDTVLGLLSPREPARTRRLGMSSQLTLVLCAAFLDDDEAIADFLADYRDFWHRLYGLGGDPGLTYDGAYRRMADRLRPRVAAVLTATRARPPEQGPALSGWVRHCHLLRRRVTALAEAGGYESRGAVARDPGRALRELLPSFVHMTNNRLGVSIAEEAYLAHLARSALSSRTSKEKAP